MAAILAVAFACTMSMSCGMVYAADQDPEVQHLQTQETITEAAASAQTEEAVPESAAPMQTEAELIESGVAEEQIELPELAAEEGDEEEKFDITAQKITNLRYDEKSGRLLWDPVEAPSGTEIKYYIYLKADNIKSGTYKIFSGAKGQMLTTEESSVDIDLDPGFKDIFINYEGADYTFYVKATDDTKDSSGRRRYSKEAASAVHSMSHNQLEVRVYTRVHTFNKSKKTFGSDLRQVMYSQGGEILKDGERLTRVADNDGEWTNVNTIIRAIRSGKTVELKYVPSPGYRFSSEKLDDGTNDRNADTARNLTMDKAHKVVVYFEQPFAEIITSGIGASSDNLEDIAGIKLISDAEAAGKKSGIEGYMQMRISEVSADSLSAAERNVCDNDTALRSRNIRRGMFLDISFYGSLDQAAPSQCEKMPKPVNVMLTIPDGLKTSDTSIRRTFYLVRVDGGDAAIIADGTLDELSGYITDSGIYMIGYKDTSLEGIKSGGKGGAGYTYAEAEAGSEPESVPESVSGLKLDVPEVVIEPHMILPPELVEDEGVFPLAAVATGASAAAACGAYGLRRLLRIITKL